VCPIPSETDKNEKANKVGMVYFPAGSPLFLLHFFGLVVTAGISVVVARWVARQSGDESGRAMVGLLLVHATMATLLVVQLLVESTLLKGLLARTWYGLILSAPVLWFVFAVYYTGRDDWLTPPVRALVGLSALVPFGLAVTDPLHHLLVVEMRLVSEPFVYYQATLSDLSTPFFALVALYTLVGFVLLVRLSLFSRRASRWQTVGLLAGMIVVYAPAALSTTSYVPIQNFPYGIYGSGLFGIIVAVSLFRTRLFAVAPLARDALLDSLGDAVVVLDDSRRIVDFNDRAVAVFGALDGNVGRQLDEVCPELLGTADWSPDYEQFEAAGPTVDELTDSPFVGTVQRTVDGESCRFNVTASEITRGGERRGFGLVISDITDLVTYSTQLERKAEQLERFAGVLSHDLRNPISVATGHLHLEREVRDSDHLRKATDALERTEAMIDDLLTLGRTGDVVADPDAVGLHQIVGDAWQTSKTDDATLTVAVDESFVVVADESRLRTLLENLFRNAIDHGGEKVTVEQLADGFAVADDGPGIPEDERSLIFEHGYSTNDDGTGFGLAIVDAVAEAHGWSIAVTDSESDGARFEVTGVEIHAEPTEA